MKKMLNLLCCMSVMSVMPAAPAMAASKESVTFQGATVPLAGNFPVSGQTAKPFLLTSGELKDVGLDAWRGKRKVLNIFVSADTPVCDASLRRFNEMAGSLPDTVVLGISADLPFAQQRLCASAGIKNVTMLSTFRSQKFGQDYGVLVESGPLQGLLTRAILVLDEHDMIIYTQLVSEITNEPEYERVLQVLKK